MPDYIRTAQIEVMLWREHLAEPDIRPALKDAIWVENIPCGPDAKGLERLQEVQEHYGFSHVTTGNASKGAKGHVCGVYVRDSAYEAASNPLRAHLADG